MNKLREQFWILGDRKTLRSVIKKCIVCHKYNSKTVQVISALLPEDRVKDAAIFETVEIDLAGPVF